MILKLCPKAPECCSQITGCPTILSMSEGSTEILNSTGGHVTY